MLWKLLHFPRESAHCVGAICKLFQFGTQLLGPQSGLRCSHGCMTHGRKLLDMCLQADSNAPAFLNPLKVSEA